MTFSMIIAWITVILAFLSASQFIIRISKVRSLKKLSHKLHIPVGTLMIVTGLFHGLFAGNMADTHLSEATVGTIFFSLNWGTICFFVSLLLALSYLFRKKLKKKWMTFHRILTICLLFLICIHIADVGVQLPARLLGQNTNSIEEETQIKNGINNSVSFSGATLKDGTYKGSAEGYKDTIEVSVNVEKGIVTSIDILKENDTPKFFNRTKKIIDEILDQQSLDVDAVSGATYSSMGIINAVNDALSSSVIDGELE